MYFHYSEEGIGILQLSKKFIPPDYRISPIFFFCFSSDNHPCEFQYLRDLTLQSFLKKEEKICYY